MTLPLLEAVPAIGSVIGLPLLGTPKPPDFLAAIGELAGNFVSSDSVGVALLASLAVGSLLLLTRNSRKA